MTTARIKRAPAQHSPSDMAKPSLYIATPCYGCMATTPYIASLRQLTRSLDHAGIEHTVELMGNESLITRARNKCVAAFLKSKATHLIFIDADVGFVPKDLASMIRSGFDVVVGAYPMKAVGWGNVHQAVKEGRPVEELSKLAGLYAVNPYVADMDVGRVDIQEREGARYIRVEDGATGFMVITRAAIERFIQHYRKDIAYVTDYEPVGETHHMVFQADRDPVALAAGKPARYLSEDYWFCRKWQQMGGEVYLNIDAKLTHTGTMRFEGDVGLLFEEDADEGEERRGDAAAEKAQGQDGRRPAEGRRGRGPDAESRARSTSYEGGRGLPVRPSSPREVDRYAHLPVSFVSP